MGFLQVLGMFHRRYFNNLVSRDVYETSCSSRLPLDCVYNISVGDDAHESLVRLDEVEGLSVVSRNPHDDLMEVS